MSLIEYFLEKKNGSRLKPKSLRNENKVLFDEIMDYSRKHKLDLPFKELVWMFINKTHIKPSCGVCGGDTKFVRLSLGYRDYCSKTCKSNSKIVKDKVRETFLEKYGGHPMGNELIKNKVKVTNMEKYGSESHLSSNLIKEKIEKTNMEKYGVKRPLQSKEIQNKTKKTMLSNHGVEHGLQSNEIHRKTINTLIEKNGWVVITEKSNQTKLKKYGDVNYNNIDKNKETCLNKYGVDSVLKIPKIRNRISDTKLRKSVNKYKHGDKIDLLSFDDENCHIHCNDCHNDVAIPRHFMVIRGNRGDVMCLECNPKGMFGLVEKEIVEDITDDYILNDRSVLDGLEVDVLIPSKSVGIEYDGLYWHNELYKDKDYHINKTKLAEQKNIDLIHIFEDEWLHKREIVTSIINNKLGNNDVTVYGRKCSVSEISVDVCRSFLEKNHIQGYVNSKIKIGLYFDGELISVMTFGGNRVALGSKGVEGEYEMLRFCNKLNTNVVGGASKLFKYFIKTYKPKKVTSYSDTRYFNGGLYEKLGFTYDGETRPNYWYVIKNKREHRYKYRKDRLVSEGFDPNKTEHQIMLERKIYRIYDCGNRRWVLVF
jgi:hypothetical protein